MQQTRRIYEVACHVFREAGCPEPLLAEVAHVEPEVALLAALYKRLWDLDWQSNEWPGTFYLLQPRRYRGGEKEFCLGRDVEALAFWLGYAREHIGELQDLFFDLLAEGLTASLPALHQTVEKISRPQRRQPWRGGVAV